MKITYTSYRPIAYWKWQTKPNQELPPIPVSSKTTSDTSSSEDDSDSDSETEALPTPGPSTSRAKPASRHLSASAKASKLARRAERIGKAKAEARRQAGEASEDDDDEDNCCGICQEAFEAACPNCRMPGDDCPLVHGKCSHVFHMHCILTWLEDERQAKGKCPLDRRPFEIAEQLTPSELEARANPVALTEGNTTGLASDITDDSMADITHSPNPRPTQQMSSPDPLAIGSSPPVRQGVSGTGTQQYGHMMGHGLGIEGHGQGTAYDAIVGNESNVTGEGESMELD